eukprot:COSAG01_NODE_8600_length_2721_cov_5.810141_2_plen_101_part_00
MGKVCERCNEKRARFQTPTDRDDDDESDTECARSPSAFCLIEEDLSISYHQQDRTAIMCCGMPCQPSFAFALLRCSAAAAQRSRSATRHSLTAAAPSAPL